VNVENVPSDLVARGENDAIGRQGLGIVDGAASFAGKIVRRSLRALDSLHP
jgi:hypothetical protein